MLFGKRFERARELQRRAAGLDRPEEQARREQQEEEKLEKGDWFALLFSSFYMLFLPAVAVLSLLVLIVCLIFGLL